MFLILGEVSYVLYNEAPWADLLQTSKYISTNISYDIFSKPKIGQTW